MSSSIDERIVEMRFDNAQFEKGVKTSIASLDSLKKSLDFKESAKGLSELEKAGRSFNMSALSSSVDLIASRFTNLGIVGVTALQNITNSAINTGKQLVKSLTLDPVLTGFSEYETKMNAITTILTNTQDKGTTLDDVNKTLQELNEYADQTIYNFAEMTRNIGTFTAAGVDLETSAKAIKGIANLAAGSGSSAQQASNAMYQLSQAIAAGRVSLQDWNSVVNAGMGGQMFQNALKETAKQMGVIVDESVSFRESISASGGQESWLTSDILVKTLEKFAEDDTLVKAATQVKTVTQLLDTMKESVQSGWAVSWEYIIGDREQAIEVLTSISDAFNDLIAPSTDARNAMLKFWNENGGRDALIEGLSNAFKGLKSVLTPVAEAFGEIFPAMDGPKLVAITEQFRKLTEQFKVSDETIQKIKSTFKGVFALFDIGIKAVSTLGKGFLDLAGYVLPLGGNLLSATAGIGEFIVGLNNAIESSDLFNSILEKIEQILSPLGKAISKFASSVSEAFSNIDTSGFKEFADDLKNSLNPVEEIGKFIKSIVDGISENLKKLSPMFAKLSSAASEIFTGISKAFSDATGEFDVSKLFSIIEGGIFASILLGVKKFISSLTSITDDAGGIVSGIKDIFEGVSGSLEEMQNSIKAGTIMKIATALGVLTASVVALSLIEPERLLSSLTAMTVMFGELFGSMTIFEKVVGSEGFKSMGKVVSSMVGLSAAILILSAALERIGKLDIDEILNGLLGIAGATTVLVVASKTLNTNAKGLTRSSVGLAAFAGALIVMAEAVSRFGELDIPTLTKGLVSVGILCAELAVFFKVANLDGMGVSKGLGIMALATSILILSKSVSSLSGLNIEELAKGISSIGVLLGELAVFMKLSGNASNVISTAVGMTILASSMLIMSKAIASIGSLSIEEIGKGLLGLSGSLAAVVLAMKLMPSNAIAIGLGMVTVASGILILANAVQSFGDMSLEELGVGLLGLAGSLTILAVAMKAMSGSVAGSAAMLVMSAALALFVPQLKSLASMSVGAIVTGLLALAGAFTVIGIAAVVLAPLAPALLALSGAIALLGAGCLAAGAGIALFATGLTALAASGVAGIAALVAAISAIIGMIPVFIQKVGEGLMAFLQVIADNGQVLIDSISTILKSLLTAIQENIPLFVDTVFLLLDTLLTNIVSFVPKLIDAGITLLMSLLSGIANNIQQVVETAVQIVVNFLNGVANMLPNVIQSGVNLIISFIEGMATAIRNNTDRMVTAIKDLFNAMVYAASRVLAESVSTFFEAGVNLVQGLIDGIKSKIEAVAEWGANLAKSAIEAAKSAAGIHSPSKKFMEIGRYSAEGLAEGLRIYSKVAENQAGKMANSVLKAASDPLSLIDSALSSESDPSIVIRPVMDLSAIQNGTKQLQRMTGGFSGFSLNGTLTTSKASMSSFKSSGATETQVQGSFSGNRSVQFVQNNYSPKALSRVEIYRQTKNQLAMIKEAVK